MGRAGLLVLAIAAAPLAAAAGESAPEDPWAGTRAHFAAAMREVVHAVEDVQVTSTHRSDADQARLAAQGYRPHPRSQHKLGLAWDVVAPAESLETLRELAVAHGFTALVMTSPVTGRSYLHVQRYARSPVKAPDPAPVETRVADAAPEPPAPEPPVAIEPPRPVAGSRLDLPRRLLRRKWDGRIVLRVAVSEDGRVVDLAVESSDLPELDAPVADAVRGWSFHPPTRDGRPVLATARLPIPIRID